MTIEVYSFQDADGDAATDWTTQNVTEAKDYARTHGYRLIANIYEWVDSEMVEDHTGV